MTDQLDIGSLLFIAYRAMGDRVFAAIAEAGYDDVTLAQFKLLQRINADGTRLGELAEATQVTKQTAGYLVDQLESGGYVERRPDPTDARARLIRQTGKAQAIHPVAVAAIAEVEAEWTAHLGKRRMDQFRDGLARLREITDPYHGR